MSEQYYLCPYVSPNVRSFVPSVLKLIVFCVGEIKEKLHYIFHTRAKCAVWKIQYSGWQIQHGGQSRGVKNLIKGGITIDRVNNISINNISVNNSNVVLDVLVAFWQHYSIQRTYWSPEGSR